MIILHPEPHPSSVLPITIEHTLLVNMATEYEHDHRGEVKNM